MTLQERADRAAKVLSQGGEWKFAVYNEMVNLVEECARFADFWASGEGLSPCHTDANRFGQMVAGQAIAESIRRLLDKKEPSPPSSSRCRNCDGSGLVEIAGECGRGGSPEFETCPMCRR